VKAKILTDKEEKSMFTVLWDGLENLIASMGTEGDKRSYAHFTNKKRLSMDGNDTELNALYRTDWVAGKVVDILPDDMTREWVEYNGEDDPEIIDKIKEEDELLDISGNFNQCHKWARLYGTALIVMDIDDGQTPDMPLNIDKIREGGLRHMKVVDRHRFEKSETVPISNPLDKNYGMPEYYRFVETSIKIHHSRVLRFDGIKLPFDEFRRNNYFSDSVLDRLYESLINLNITANGSASMVHEANVDVIKIKGLMNYLMTVEGEKTLRKRFSLANLLKSFNNVHLLDSEEDFQKQSNSFTGLPDLIHVFAQLVSAASDIPATRLLGISASGFNATGEGDLKNYYDKVRSLQISEYKPKLDYLFEILQRSMRLLEPIDYKFNSLFQMTPKEEADLHNMEAQTAKQYWDIGALDEMVVAKELKQKKIYTNIDEYIKELEEMPDEELTFTNPKALGLNNEQQIESGEEEESSPGENPEDS
jgi:phage-related protein (TIGR01555 family)